MSKKAVVGIGAGCLGCVGIPALLAIGGVGGWLLANQQRDAEPLGGLVRPSEPGSEPSLYAEESDWRSEERESRSRERDREVAVQPVEKPAPELFPAATATPAPVVARLPVVTPTPAPVVEKRVAPVAVATPAPIVVERRLEKPSPVATPAPAALSSAASAPKATPVPAAVAVLKSVPMPKATPRSFDDGDELLTGAKPAKKAAKLASAAPATTGPETEEDMAVAALFGDQPGSALKPAATPAAAPAPSAKTLRSIRTQNGVVEANIGRQIVLQTKDKKTVMGTLTKAEAGWVVVKLSDGKTKNVQESEIVDASEL